MSVESFFGVLPSVVTFRFINPPVLGDDENWKWPPLEVKKVQGTEMNGLFAAQKIEAGLLIPYAGRSITRSMAKNTNNSYQMEAKKGCVIVDAMPSLSECASQYCIGGFTNEPSENARKEKFNCCFVELWAENSVNAPKYAHADHADWPYLMVMSPLKAGEQLFVSYGPSYEENRKHFGYNAKDSQKPESYANNKADWEYTQRAYKAAVEARTPFSLDESV
jgi:hypothetical protein